MIRLFKFCNGIIFDKLLLYWFSKGGFKGKFGKTARVIGKTIHDHNLVLSSESSGFEEPEPVRKKCKISSSSASVSTKTSARGAVSSSSSLPVGSSGVPAIFNFYVNSGGL